MPGDDATAPSAQTPPAPVYVMAQPVEVRKFYGDEGDRSRVLDFKAEMLHAWEAQPSLSSARKLDMLKQNVGRDIQLEITCMSPETTADPMKVLEKLVEIFGERRSPSALLQELLSIRQHPGEPTRKFSCRLKLAFDTLQKREVVLNTTSKTNVSILRDHFLSGLYNKHLQSYLREKLVDTPGLDFIQVREIAIRWDPEVEPEASLSYVAVPAQSLTPAHSLASAQSLTPAPTTSPDLAQVQAQLAGLTTAVQQLLDLQIQQQQARQPQRSNRRRADGFNNAGQAVCFRCRSTEHRVKDCPVSGNATPQS